MLEDELEEIIARWPILTQADAYFHYHKLSCNSHSSYKELLKHEDGEHIIRCKRIAELISSRLLEAFSSPSPYIREWARLIEASQHTAQDTAIERDA
jgi:hypothetical protein